MELLQLLHPRSPRQVDAPSGAPRSRHDHESKASPPPACDPRVVDRLRRALLRDMDRVIDLFRRLDANGDGSVTRQEFRKALPMLMQRLLRSAAAPAHARRPPKGQPKVEEARDEIVWTGREMDALFLTVSKRDAQIYAPEFPVRCCCCCCCCCCCSRARFFPPTPPMLLPCTTVHALPSSAARVRNRSSTATPRARSRTRRCTQRYAKALAVPSPVGHRPQLPLPSLHQRRIQQHAYQPQHHLPLPRSPRHPL